MALKGATLSDFLTSFVAKHQKIEEGTVWGIFSRKKSHNAKKTENGDPLISPGIVCYSKKKEGKPFWFSSLGQMIQFGTIKFRRLLWNYFGQFVWIKKVTIIVAFHFV